MDILETLKRLMTPPTQEEIIAKSRDPRGYMNLPPGAMPRAPMRNVAAEPAPMPAAPPQQFNMTAPDLSGTADMNAFLSQGIARNAAQAAKDKAIMDNLPDISGVKSLMINPAKPELGPLVKPLDNTPTPFPTPPPPEPNLDPASELPPEKPKAVAKKAAPKAEAKIEAKPVEAPKEEELTLKEPTLDEILAKAQQQPEKDQEMMDAQDQRRQNRLMMAMGKAGEQIGAGIGSVKSDSEYLNNLQPMVDAPVGDLKERRTAEREKQKDIMDRTKFALDTERGKQDYAMSKLTMQKAQMDLNDATMRNDPSSDASQLARVSTIDALKRMNRPDLVAQVQKQNMSASQLEKAFGNMSLSNMLTAYEGQQNRLAMEKERAEVKRIAAKEKLEQKDQKRLEDISKLINEDFQRMNTPIGKNANLVNTAERLEVLVGSKKPGEITNQQIYEIARGLDAMLSAGASTIGGTQHLLPIGWKTEYAKAAEIAGNAPVGAGQVKYVQQAIDTIGREKAKAKEQISDAVRGAMGPYMDLADKESFQTMLRFKGIDPDMVLKGKPAAAPQTAQKMYSAGQEAGIKQVMDKNNISREEAIKALTDAGKLK